MTVFDDAYAYFKDNPDELCLMWTRFNWTFPPPKPFLEFVFRGRDYVAWYEDQPPPPPNTIRVKVNAAPSLRVRSKPVDGDVIGQLANGLQVEVFEAQEVTGWYKLANTAYAGNYISAQYVTKVD
jgi:hypothetical protein